MRWTLLVSLAVHAAAAPLAPKSGLSDQDMKNLETEYGKKIAAAKSAGVVARKLEGRSTMPPPPPDPEKVVTQNLTDEVSFDVEKVAGNFLDARVTSNLAKAVARNLKDEISAMAKAIADGKLTEDEIRQLQEKFRKKSIDATAAVLKDYRVQTQVERAKMSTTEWYESTVGPTLMSNLHFELFGGPQPYSHHIWIVVYGGRYGREEKWPIWQDTHRSCNLFSQHVQALDQLVEGVSGHRHEKGQYVPVIHTAWPGPNREQAEHLVKNLARISQRCANKPGADAEWAPSFDDTIYGGCNATGLLKDYFPHRKDEIAGKYKEKLAGQWKKALADAGAYASLAESGPAETDLKEAQGACFQDIREILKTSKELLGEMRLAAGQYDEANWAALLEVLTGPEREKLYRYLIDELAAGLQPAIRDFAVGQFEEGIIKWEQGAEDAMKEFPKQITPLLRRDLEKMLPKKKFDEVIFSGVIYPCKAYTSDVTKDRRAPSDAEVKAQQAAMAKLVAGWPESEKAYVEKRRQHVAQDFKRAIKNVKEEMLTLVFSGNLLLRKLDVEGVDYADKVQEKLDTRQRAKEGRGQDYAKLTRDGVPDTSAARFSLYWGGSKGHGANLEPVPTQMQPAYQLRSLSAAALRASPFVPARAPAKWGFEEQAPAEKIKPKFATPRFEGIPFLSKFPRLDGNLADWGKVRPLILQAPQGKEPILLYAAWNYQGFFFGYSVKAPAERFIFPSMSRQGYFGSGTQFNMEKAKGLAWAYASDHLRLYFDTLDARNQNRGEPHTQEFVVFPRGTDTNPEYPGMERVIASQRDAKTKQYRGMKASAKMFPQQPPPEHGPDGLSPYRVTQVRGADADEGYCVEVFLPRSLFNTPVFAPGWHTGFDCAVASNFDGQRFAWQFWACGANTDRVDDEGHGAAGANPSQWGDLLLLGTDARLSVEEPDAPGTIADAIVPGHSYLLTVIDPDRNVNPSLEDTVLVSAEIKGGNNDVEVFILKETEKNSSVFRGYINTQPGAGREMQGAVECMPGQEARLGYVDFANAKGDKDVIVDIKLPVVTGMMRAGTLER